MIKQSIAYCGNCGESFSGQNGVYCGMDCYLQHVRKLRAIKAKEKATGGNCKNCGISCRSDRVFCSKECYSKKQKGGAYSNKNPTYKAANCLHCNTEIHLPKTENYKNRENIPQFCSRNCYDKYRAESRLRNCKHCGDEFSAERRVKGKGRAIYCSMDCRKTDMRAKPRNCKSCGHLFTPIKMGSQGKYVTCQYVTCSEECRLNLISTDEVRRKKISLAFRGSKHPMWQGGHGDVHRGYRGPGWNRIAEEARKRDKYVCQHCGIAQDDCKTKLEVHHIIPFRQNTTESSNKLSNLMSLCKSCHTKADHKYRKENQVQMVLL